MTRILRLVKYHVIALAAALALTLLILGPAVAFPITHPESYRGINVTHISDQYFYLAREKDALEGHSLGQPFLAEGKDAPDATFTSVERILISPLRISGFAESVDIVTYLNVANALGVFVMSLFMYAFLYIISGNRLISAAGVVFAVGGYTITEAHTLFYNGYNIYGRIIYPFTSSVPFFAFLYCLAEVLIRKKSLLYAATAGVLLGLMCYVYLYAWTFTFALLGSLGLIAIVRKDLRVVSTVSYVGLIGALIGSWNLILLFTTLRGDIVTQLSYYYFSIHSHAFVMSNTGAITAILIVLALWRKGWRNNSLFILGVILAGWVALNQQTITGRMLQYGHYFWYFVSPLSIMIASYLVWEFLHERWKKWFAFGLITLGLFTMAGQQYRTYKIDIPSKIAEQKYAPILQTLRSKPYGVVLSGLVGDSASYLVTTYTNDDLYWNSGAQAYIFSLDRLKEALLVYLYLNKYSRIDPISFLQKKLAAGERDQYTSLYGEIEGFYSGFDYKEYQRRYSTADPALEPVRSNLLAELDSRYRVDFRSPDLYRSILKDRNVRYVIWDQSANPEWDLSVLSPKKMSESEDLVLYAVGD